MASSGALSGRRPDARAPPDDAALLLQQAILAAYEAGSLVPGELLSELLASLCAPPRGPPPPGSVRLPLRSKEDLDRALNGCGLADALKAGLTALDEARRNAGGAGSSSFQPGGTESDLTLVVDRMRGWAAARGKAGRGAAVGAQAPGRERERLGLVLPPPPPAAARGRSESPERGAAAAAQQQPQPPPQQQQQAQGSVTTGSDDDGSEEAEEGGGGGGGGARDDAAAAAEEAAAAESLAEADG